ncbi:hypothetical protein P8452_49453 [Trifolium repens]|nr:hypothetical protein P8452_49453 [Trifolium repens]
MPFGFNFNLFNLFNVPRRRNVITFEEGLKTLQKGIVKLFNIVEGSEPDFTPEEHIMLYTTVFKLCSPNALPCYDHELCNLYKETCEDYIRSKVLPSLQGKQDNEHLLRVLLERWSIYKIMTERLTSIFSPLNKFYSLNILLPNLEETSFLSFYHLVYEEMHQEIIHAIFDMIDRKVAGEKVEHTFVINTLDFYFKFDECTRKNSTKEEKVNCSPDFLLKNIILISFDGVVLVSDYGVTLMSERFADITQTISVDDEVDTISVHKMNGEMLEMVLAYCKNVKHNSTGLLTDFELKDWIAKFLNVDPETLLHLLTSACYMKVDSLMKLTWSKIDAMIKGKTPEEISQIFGAAADN